MGGSLTDGASDFGGPPAHIALFRRLCVVHNAWLSAEQFEDAIATTNLLPGPGSTQLSVFCAWRLLRPSSRPVRASSAPSSPQAWSAL